MATCWAIGHLSSHSKALPFCHVTLKGQKPLPHGYPAQPKTLGDQLRKKRMDLGLSQRALASQLGVSRTSIENWEGNEVKPARWMMTRIKEFLGLQISQTPASFAERLTTYRRGLGVSQEALARMIGVHKTTVVRWETGRRHPSKARLQKIGALLTEAADCPDATLADTPSER